MIHANEFIKMRERRTEREGTCTKVFNIIIVHPLSFFWAWLLAERLCINSSREELPVCKANPARYMMVMMMMMMMIQHSPAPAAAFFAKIYIHSKSFES